MVQGADRALRKVRVEMKAFLNIFRRNWGLKLLALALALVIYYSMRNSSGRSRIPQSFLKGAENGGSK